MNLVSKNRAVVSGIFLVSLCLMLTLGLFLSGCGTESKTANTSSHQFTTLAEKQTFLERYLIFRRNYDDLHFSISYSDGNTGIVPGPTEWDIRIFATVPDSEIRQWIHG